MKPNTNSWAVMQSTINWAQSITHLTASVQWSKTVATSCCVGLFSSRDWEICEGRGIGVEAYAGKSLKKKKLLWNDKAVMVHSHNGWQSNQSSTRGCTITELPIKSQVMKFMPSWACALWTKLMIIANDVFPLFWAFFTGLTQENDKASASFLAAHHAAAYVMRACCGLSLVALLCVVWT